MIVCDLSTGGRRRAEALQPSIRADGPLLIMIYIIIIYLFIYLIYK